MCFDIELTVTTRKKGYKIIHRIPFQSTLKSTLQTLWFGHRIAKVIEMGFSSISNPEEVM